VSVRRLCSQVREALTYALADCADPVLQSLFVAGVMPAPDATRLAVLLCGDEAARAKLALAAPRLRAEVAHAIHRKRAPELVFRVTADAGGAA
jgi:ribosome-binding factor A